MSLRIVAIGKSKNKQKAPSSKQNGGIDRKILQLNNKRESWNST